jgi:uncharacterized protein DUF5063/uncharacterized protein DUF6869
MRLQLDSATLERRAMDMADVETLAKAWVRLQENWWAHDVLDEASEHDPELAWAVICRVFADAPTQEVLDVTAAGLLEDLLRAHGAAFIERVEAAARSSVVWREALHIARLPPADDPVTQRLFALGCARAISVLGLPSGFIGDVREYLQLIESSYSLPLLTFLSRAADVLGRIYSATWKIEPAQPTEEMMSDRRPSPMKRLASQLGAYDPYFCVFNPRAQDEPVTGSLADDLADIYLELAAALDEFNAGRHDAAVWGWRFVLQGHAGDHLVRALPALHAIVREESS